jgi:hypothetical protein
MRLGKVFDNNNPFKDGFEVGVATEMEHAKERGNQYTKTGNRGDIECNQWNDLFELDVKMHGHAATVDNYTFFRMLLDDQRPDSLSADNRDLCDIVMIKDVSDPKIVMPFFAIGEATYLGATKIFNKIYYYVRHNRGDNTLLVYLLKKIYAPIKNHYVRIFNRYSVYVATLRVSDAMTDERLTDRGKYYVSTKKVYSNRFATDAINEFYHRKNLRSKNGLNDFPAYTDLHPTCDDLKDIHSHFYKQILQTFDIENATVAERKNIAEKISVKHTKNTK